MNKVRDVVVYFVTQWFDRNKVGKVVVGSRFNKVLNAGIDEHEIARMFVGVEVSLIA